MKPETRQPTSVLPNTAPETTPARLSELRLPERGWLPMLSCYQVASLTFPDHEAMGTALGLIGTAGLENLPYKLLGGKTILVPKDSVPLFLQAGVACESSPPNTAPTTAPRV